MPQNLPEFEKLIRSLDENEVRFVIVGGIAMVLHGSDYSTVDSDFAVADDSEVTEPLVRALAGFNPRPTHFSPGTPFVWDARSIFGAVISLSTDAGDVDLLRVLPGVDSFDGLMDRSVVRRIFGMDVHVASIQDLIAMKKAANRPKDLNHISELEALAALQNDHPESGR